MRSRTRALWAKQNQHEGDRRRLFRVVGEQLTAERVLYPGSYVDIAASFVFPSVTYVDVDKRAEAFFADGEGVRTLIGEQEGSPADPNVTFLHADYTEPLPVPIQNFDLLISLYAGFVSESCTQYLRVGGTLLVNPSHGDAAMASLDPRYRLSGVIQSRSGQYRIRSTDLDTFLIPKKPTTITKAGLHESGRGVAYTKSAFAYLFERVE